MAQYYLGVDVGASFIRIGVVNVSGEIVDKVKVPMPQEGDEDTVANIIIKGASENLGKYLPSISAVGIGSIGPLDLKAGNVLIAPNLRWRVKRFRLYAPLRRGLGLPVVIGNDAMASVWGEYLFGQGVGKSNVVYITLSTGIGMGVVVDGHLLVGKDGNAHEMGHAVVDIESDLQCGCGGYGHLEAIAGGGNIPKSARWYLEKRYRGQMSELALMVKEGKATTPDLFNGFKKGDPFAVEFIDYVLKAIAAGVANTINAYDPEVVILGGSVFLNNVDVIMDGLNKYVKRYVANRMPEITGTRFGDDIGIIGAAALALRIPESLKPFIESQEKGMH
ncbi:ROK family protein [Caldivirga sp. UBA161]|uniref:ROK family protein n=1 Tax=Caldivirga sp. UBA161 TaxID=1915569 RepID=UPI0025C4652E|nr:ROK family protein [Caldivirga sp. UBA161]